MAEVPAPARAGDAEATQARTRALLDRVEAALREAVTSADPFVSEAASHLLNAGGKRFRPTLVLLCGHFGNPDHPYLVDVAAAIELTHLATLHHDDVMDEAQVRRGGASANARYDNKVAILVGDYLFARASGIAARLGPEVIRTLAGAVSRLVEGQIREVRGPLPGEDLVAHYMSVLADKTGSLIAAACRLGGVVAGAPAAHVRALEAFGEHLGVAFQLGDDLLDITRERAATGKQPGTDLREGVCTLPVLFHLRRGGPEARVVQRALGGDERAVEEALAVLRASPALAEARAAAQAEVDRALAALADLPDLPARAALAGLTSQVLDREA